ncbi:hypothetical protein H0H92_013234 [Tricholoma furcatifolium]|nr:hypothetical protein H0H92_013234 [Tricholoma furcatifolium]
MSKTPPKLQLGKRIDGDALEFVEVLGVGGYGVVYRAIDLSTPERHSYAVKCLLHSKDQRPVRRQLHIREIALHQISSAHPGIVTLHRIVEDDEYTYIIMDYAPDHDLFTQILNNCRYLGNDALIKHVFLQLVDAVEYCHSLGIYHRDLKPENILCFDDGCSVAITDFGLATTEKVSEELHTGSIYHMSPECQGGAFSLDGCYSPKSNDVWSLGIILLNLATGRNPWKTATADDLTFQAYLKDPFTFFPSVLPVSLGINDILLQMLHVDWRQRATLAELRQQMEEITTFYAPDVVFDGSQARCSWEAANPPPKVVTAPKEEILHVPASQDLTSYWIDDSYNEDTELKAHDTPACGLLSPQVSGFPLENAAPQVSLGGMLESASSSESSNSSHPSFSTSPSTPGSNDKFSDLGLVEISTEDVFERARPRDQHEIQETGMVPTMSSSQFLKIPRHSPMDVRVQEDDTSWSTTDSSETVPMWAIIPKLKSSLTWRRSSACEVKSTAPSQDTAGSSHTPPNRSGTIRSEDKAFFNPMKLFSRPIRLVSPTRKDPPASKPHPVDADNAEMDVIEVGVTDGGKRAERSGASTRNWFLPTKLFVSTATAL